MSAARSILKQIVGVVPGLQIEKASLAIGRPLNHVVRGLNLDPTITEKGAFYVSWFFFFPARPFPAVDLGNGARIGGNNHTWAKYSVDELKEIIGNEIAPILEQCSTPEGALDLLKKKESRDHRGFEELAYGYAVVGEYQNALQALDLMEKYAASDNRDWVHKMIKDGDRLREAIKSGEDAVHNVLKENERFSLESIGLESD